MKLQHSSSPAGWPPYLYLGFCLGLASAAAQTAQAQTLKRGAHQSTASGQHLDIGVVRYYPAGLAAQCEPSYSLLPSVRDHGIAEAGSREVPSFSVAAVDAPSAVLQQVQPNGETKLVPVPNPDQGKILIRDCRATIPVAAGTSLYGVGLEFGPLERGGKKYEMWNLDAFGYGPQGPNHLYESHPWVLGVRRDGTAFGILADTTYDATVDLTSGVTFDSGHPFPVIVIERSSPQTVIEELTHLTGTMPMPPKWALGYQQCHYSYAPQSTALSIAQQARAAHMPCDVVWLDIDYMDHYRDFSFDPKGFPDPSGLNAAFHKLHFHDVWMIDSAVRTETDPAATKVFSTGTAQHVWARNPDGTPFYGDQWPSIDADKATQAPSVYPDFTAPRVRSWWASQFPAFLAKGIDGVWNDMNEPSVFRHADDLGDKTMPLDSRHSGDPALRFPVSAKQQGPVNANDDHARYHNVYGMLMAEGTRDGMQLASPAKRPFVLSRSNYIGGQKYAAVWTGDNTASWDHLKASIPMVLNLGLSGQPFAGPDIGGYRYPDSPGKVPLTRAENARLFSRWLGFASLLPFARAHSEKGFGPSGMDWHEEPWAFGPQATATNRLALERRYRLLPYLYTLFRRANTTGLPIAAPVFFADPADARLRSVDSEFLLGNDLLVSAQVNPTGRIKTVLPKGDWQPLAFRQGDRPGAPMDSANPDLPSLYLRGGAIVPSGPISEYVDEHPNGPLTLLVALDASGHASGTLYEDAGNGYGYLRGQYRTTGFVAQRAAGKIMVVSRVIEGQLPAKRRAIIVRVLENGRERVGRGVEDGLPIMVQ